MAAKKFWLPARARRKGGVGGIPPRPSVPPERSGGGQFRSKNVRAELYNSTKLEPISKINKADEILRNYFAGGRIRKTETKDF